MSDLSLEWPWEDAATGDFETGPDDDLSTVDGDEETRQSYTRRLLTNARDFLRNSPIKPDPILSPDHPFECALGVGLRRKIGAVVSSTEAAAIRQMCMDAATQEPGIASSPPPIVKISPLPYGASAQTLWTSALTGTPQSTPVITPPT